jgi:thiol-disulfide isomerase/thioredoxin
MKTKRAYLNVLVSGTIFLFLSCGDKSGEENGSASAESKPNLELSGKFTNTNQETVVLYYLPVSGEQVIDSAKIDETGNFKFENLRIPGIGFYSLKLDNQNFCPLILDAGQKVKISGDAKNLGYTYKTEGSKDTEVFQEITELSMDHKTRIDSLGADFQAKLGPNNMNEAVFKEMSKQYEAIYSRFTDNFSKQLVEIVNKNPRSLACITAAAQLDPDIYVGVYRKLDDELTKAYPDYPKVTTFHEQVSKYLNLAIGSDAPELNLADPQGTPVSLSSLKGKVVMIDFWASWCKPCRRENPNVVKMYKKYKGKGFEILGVSLDENKEEWVKAIANDALSWKHVCDFGGWGSAAAKAYDVTQIPYTVLVGKDGRIINKGLRGEALETRLKELLK